jgi:hypothetical protein
MTRRKRPEGKCHICGNVGPLSWEHVPPEAAYNEHPVVRATKEQLLMPEQWDGKRGLQGQRGSGAYSLCEPCNNKTGAWYGTEYVSWAKQEPEHLARIPPHEEGSFSFGFEVVRFGFLSGSSPCSSRQTVRGSPVFIRNS